MEVRQVKGKFVDEKYQIRVKRKSLQAVLEECKRALESLSNCKDGTGDDDDADDEDEDDAGKDAMNPQVEVRGVGILRDEEADELCDLLKSRVQCSDFLEKLECAQASVPENIADGSSWDMVNANDLWQDEIADLDQEDYVLVSQEDIVEGIACFMAAYLLSLKQTKDLSPIQLQQALSKTFSLKKKKGKLQKAWDGSKVIYNLASWGATAIGIYQNPLLMRAASKAFWTSCEFWFLNRIGDVVMVCQAASQTRFRALKYENGIAGTATIVVRVIACFQPLQDCQAEYFRHLLKPKLQVNCYFYCHNILTTGDCSGWMGEGCESWFPLQQFDWQSPKSSPLAASHPLGQQSTNPRFVNFGTNIVSASGALPVYGCGDLPNLRVGQVNESHGWCYCLPRSQQVFAPVSNTFLKGQLPPNPYGNCTENIATKAGAGCAQKRFLVFYQSGSQTTRMLNSAFETPTKCGSLGPKLPFACNLSREDPLAKVSLNLHPGPTFKGVFDENGTDVQSEMHEDTEELNALLYSDDDSDYTEDEEVTSTGHSPSTMTAYYEQSEGGAEGVASSTGLTKKRKLLDGSNGYMQLPVENTRSVNHNICSEHEDDADSSFAKGQNPGSDGMDSSSGNKRMRVDKIRETVSVLRSLITGVEGKDAIMVLDEAIDYLKSLKRKAGTLGLGTL
ncbi:hypothetical protein V6N11_004044 [Hibiscus sabdariffa]|uniref:BHLH domain-containing protein n=1 Tax=Hibiscus sabdariffa TaxID=183260 RepID=A0ABR2SF78_9ROSI